MPIEAPQEHGKTPLYHHMGGSPVRGTGGLLGPLKRSSLSTRPKHCHLTGRSIVPSTCSLAQLPAGAGYSPFPPRKDEYVQEAFSLGFIHPCTSSVGASFFFVKKKYGGLRPCIDYRGLNAVTQKDQHPLPLMSSAFYRPRFFKKNLI